MNDRSIAPADRARSVDPLARPVAPSLEPRIARRFAAWRPYALMSGGGDLARGAALACYRRAHRSAIIEALSLGIAWREITRFDLDDPRLPAAERWFALGQAKERIEWTKRTVSRNL